jgi:hypothetical protein
MRRLITVLIAAAMTMALLILKANAQGNGNGLGNNKHEWKDNRGHAHQVKKDGHRYHDYDRRERRNHPGGNEEYWYGGHRHVYHRPVITHYHTRSCGHAIAVRHYERPRYVYYRDYNVYYDHSRNIYISYADRRWFVSATIPVHLQRVDLRAADYDEVNYFEDDFLAYLEVRQPVYGNVVRMR